MKRRKNWSTENRLICALFTWFYESHASWPKRVRRVYGLKEYFTDCHVWVEEFSFWHTLYRAVGTVFPTCQKRWDRLENKLWPPESVTYDTRSR